MDKNNEEAASSAAVVDSIAAIVHALGKMSSDFSAVGMAGPSKIVFEQASQLEEIRRRVDFELSIRDRDLRWARTPEGDTGGNSSHKGQKITYHAATDRLMRCGGLPQHTGKRARNWGLRVRETDSNRWLHFNGSQLFARTGNTDALRFINYAEAEAVAVAAGLEKYLKPHPLPPSRKEVLTVIDARSEVWGIRLNTDVQSPFLYYRDSRDDGSWTAVPDSATLRTFAAMTHKKERLLEQARVVGVKVPEYEIVRLK